MGYWPFPLPKAVIWILKKNLTYLLFFVWKSRLTSGEMNVAEWSHLPSPEWLQSYVSPGASFFLCEGPALGSAQNIFYILARQKISLELPQSLACDRQQDNPWQSRGWFAFGAPWRSCSRWVSCLASAAVWRAYLPSSCLHIALG